MKILTKSKEYKQIHKFRKMDYGANAHPFNKISKVMNLRYIKIMAPFMVAVYMFSACSDWLHIEPENGITVNMYWKSEQDVHAAVMGCYASMLGGTAHPIAEAVFNWGEMRADLIKSFRSINRDFEAINMGEILPTNPFTRWNGVYTTINHCNTVLEKAPPVLSIDAAFTNEKWQAYKGEVLGLRALMYFYLVRTFGEVPIVLEATTSDTRIKHRPKSSQQDVLNQILTDLNEAEKFIKKTYSNNKENKGRINYYTVKTIKADVYLWMDNYAEAIKACDAVIESKQYALIPGNDAWFSTLYVEGNSPEGIFELQFAQDILNPYYNLFRTRSLYRTNVETAEYLWPVNILALPEDADIRSDGASYKSSDGYSIWKYIGFNRSDAKTANDATSNWIIYRYADIILMKAEALANLDRGGEALTLINIIRDRANAPDDTKQNPTDQFGLTSYIVDERGREFAFEGKRWFDLLRNAKRNNYARKELLTDMAVRSAPPQKLESLLNKLKDPNFHYLPIFQTEINTSHPILKQNPFYEQK